MPSNKINFQEVEKTINNIKVLSDNVRSNLQGVDNLITDKLPLEFSSWVARMRTPEALVDAIRIYQQSASTEVRTYFALQNDGSFTSDIIMVEAHKAA